MNGRIMSCLSPMLMYKSITLSLILKEISMPWNHYLMNRRRQLWKRWKMTSPNCPKQVCSLLLFLCKAVISVPSSYMELLAPAGIVRNINTFIVRLTGRREARRVATLFNCATSVWTMAYMTWPDLTWPDLLWSCFSCSFRYHALWICEEDWENIAGRYDDDTHRSQC